MTTLLSHITPNQRNFNVGGAGDMDRIKYLMKHGLDLNVPDKFRRYTYPYTAAIVRDLDLVEYFLDMEQT